MRRGTDRIGLSTGVEWSLVWVREQEPGSAIGWRWRGGGGRPRGKDFCDGVCGRSADRAGSASVNCTRRILVEGSVNTRRERNSPTRLFMLDEERNAGLDNVATTGSVRMDWARATEGCAAWTRPGSICCAAEGSKDKTAALVDWAARRCCQVKTPAPTAMARRTAKNLCPSGTGGPRRSQRWKAEFKA